MKKVFAITLTTIFLLQFTNIKAQQVTTEWVINNFTGYPVGVMIGLDNNDNVFVTGQSGDYARIITTKYNTAGTLIWQRFYTVSGLGVNATWLSVDPSGNIIVTGYPLTMSGNPIEVGLLTLKYDNNGNLLWDRYISGTWAFAVRSIVDLSGNIYVTGRAWQYTSTYDFVTVKYAPDGTQLWFDTFDQNGGFHTPTSMTLDQAGNLFITGAGMSGGLITVMYNSAGVRQWVREDAGGAGQSIKVDGNGGIFVTGALWNNVTGDDFLLLKYNLSGNLVWQRVYDFGNFEEGKLINVDSHSNLFITGNGSLPGQFTGWLTAKLDSSGNLLWFRRFKLSQTWEEYPYFALIGPEDELYVTGNVGVTSSGNQYHGLETIRYNSNGSNPWVAAVDQYSGIGKGLALGTDMSLYAVGQFYYSVIKYSQTPYSTITFNRNNLNRPIQDLQNTFDTINVNILNPLAGIVSNVRVRIDTVIHPNDGDLEFSLLHLGVNDTIIYRAGSTGDNFIGTTLNDLAATLIENGSAPFTGTYKPSRQLSQLIGTNLNGNWILKIYDRTTGNTGTLKAWSLIVTFQSLTAVNTQNNYIPKVFNLKQNYPNPFNPVTKISFALPKSSFVKLLVYDILGKKVSVLADERLTAGTYNYNWSGTDLPSGVYFYKLTAGDFVQTKKMVLLK
jgi:hypothetical protein